MKLAPRDSLDVDRRIPVTEIRHQLLFCNCKLESLSLSGNKFTDNAAKDFAAALQHSNCKLESLHLSYNNFTDKAAKDFAAALQHNNCKLGISLSLSENKFTDNAAKDLGEALKAHANARNIVGQQHATLLGPTCCERLHTMLFVVSCCCDLLEVVG